MKSNLKKFINVSLIVLCSFIISLLFEIFIDNREVLNKKTSKNPEILEMKGIVKEENRYKTVQKNSYIVIKVDENYISKLKFSYKSKKDFTWNISYKVDENTINSNYTSTYLINKTIKNIGTNTDKIKITFNDRNIVLYDFIIDNDIFIDFERIMFLTISISIILILFINRKYFIKNIDKLFLFLSLSFCFLMISILPKTVYVSFDDQIHYKRIINSFKKDNIKNSYAEQILISGIGYRDDKFLTTKEEKYEFYKFINKIHKESKNRTISVNEKPSIYSNIVYVPFFIGYKISNMLNLNLTLCIIISKFFNSILYSLIFYLAIKWAKYGKKIIFAIGLLPSNIFLASNFSHDPTITAALTLATVFFINIITEDKLNKKDLIGFIFAVIFASLPKAIYCPLLLLLLFIKNDKFNNKKQAYIFKVCILVITFLLLSTFVFPAISGSLLGDSRGGNTSVNKQLNFIFHNPILYIKILLKFSYYNLLNLFLGIGNFSGFAYVLDEHYFVPLYLLNLIFILYVIFTSEFPKKVDKTMNILFVLELICIYVLICTALYLSFTPVGEYSINGVQGRYFIPLLYLLFILLIPRKNNQHSTSNNYLVSLMPVFIFLSSCAIITLRFL